MSTDAGHHFNCRKRLRPADGLSHRRLHGLQRKPRSLLDAVPSCFVAIPPIPPEAGSAAFDMGNFFSSAFSGCMPRDGGLGLYRDWVDASKNARDLTVATRDDVALRHGVLSRRILDPRKAALQAMVPPWEKKRLFYKDALEEAGLRNKRLGESEVEVRLQTEILDELRKPKEDLTVATRDDMGLRHGVLSRRILDPRKVAFQAVVPPWEKREPFYKDALEKAGLRDKRLREIEVEVRLQAEILDELRKPKEDLSQFFIPLTAEDEKKVHNSLYGSGLSSEVLVLHESSNIEVSREKIRCLRPHGWLNDEVINLYLELLKERGIREPKRSLKCHFFNTFFYKKLACGKTGYDYKSVKRWTTSRKLGYGLIECDKVFVPVHQNVHWCLAVINMKAKTLQYLDSLGGNDPCVPRMLARYIVEEVKDKSNKEIDINSWTEEVVDYIPLQQNGYDCGMFMLKYIDFLSRGASLSFDQEHMEYFRKRTAKEILKLRAD